MYGKISLKDYAGHANLPLPTVYVRQGSAATIGFLDVPDAATSVSFTAVNVAGVALTVAAAKVDGIWTATLPASHFAAAGNVENGITIKASDGTSEWSLGVGGLVVLSAEATPAPGETATNVTDKTLDGEEMDTGTIGGLREAVRKLGGALGATVTALALMFAPAADGAGVMSAKLQDIPLDTGTVVTNVDFSGVGGGISTNDVCNIVTNDVVEYGDWECSPSEVAEGHISLIESGEEDGRYWMIVWFGSRYPIGNKDSTSLTFSLYDSGTNFTVVATRQAITRNALGLARLVDLPPLTNGLPEAISAKASTNDVLLTPVYSQTPTYGNDWTYEGLGEGLTVIGSPEFQEGSGPHPAHWVMQIFDGTQGFVLEDYNSGATASTLHFGESGAITATRTRTDIIGYTLGTQTNKVLASTSITNGLASAGSVAVASAAIAQSATNYTDSATNSLNQSIAPTVSAVAQSSTNYTDSATNSLNQSIAPTVSAAIAAVDTSYPRVIGITNINQTVQYVSIDSAVPTTLSIMLPTSGDTKDWIVYVTAQTNVTISLPAATWWLADTSATNDIAPQTPTALYFSQAADGIYTLGRQEFTEVVLP